MEHRIHFTRREQQNTLQSHLLVPVSINGRSSFPFCVEPSRSRTLVSARTIEAMGLAVDDSSSTLTISERLAYPLLRLESIAVGSAVLSNFEVVVWGSPAIPPDILANLGEDKLYPDLGHGHAVRKVQSSRFKVQSWDSDTLKFS